MKELKEIKHIHIKNGMKVSELVGQMHDVGFGESKIAEASNIMANMFKDEECKVFLGVAGAMVPGGMKQIIIDMLDKVDVFVTTGATLTHDLIESLGEKHYKYGYENEPNDIKLNEEGLDRMYNVLMQNKVYEELEEFFEENYAQLKDIRSIKEFLWKLGELCPGRGILKKCWEKNIPVFCPGIADSGIGLMMWGREASGKGESEARVFCDLKEIIDVAWTSKKNGVIYVGGGLPKNFIQQALQFSKKGADYGVQITGDRQELGGSSGAPLREGISWGKMAKDAEFVDVYCDATIALPLIFAGVL